VGLSRPAGLPAGSADQDGDVLGASLGISLGVELSTGASDSEPDDVVELPDGEQASRAAAMANNRIERFNNKRHLLGSGESDMTCRGPISTGHPRR
jgi:hypothetical protein